MKIMDTLRKKPADATPSRIFVQHNELTLLLGKLQAESRTRNRHLDQRWAWDELAEGVGATLALAYLVAVFARDLATFLS